MQNEKNRVSGRGLQLQTWGAQACVGFGGLTVYCQSWPSACREQGIELEREGRRALRNTLGNGGAAGWRAVGVLFIVGMDGAAVGAAQHADDRQHQAGQWDSIVTMLPHNTGYTSLTTSYIFLHCLLNAHALISHWFHCLHLHVYLWFLRLLCDTRWLICINRIQSEFPLEPKSRPLEH